MSASGARTAPDFTVSADSDSLTASGRTVKTIKLTASGKADIANPSANVSLTGSVNDQPLDIKAALVTSDGKRSINGFLVSLGDNKVSGDLALDDKFMPLGTLTLDAPAIAERTRVITTWPSPLSPSTRAEEGVSRTVRMSGCRL